MHLHCGTTPRRGTDNYTHDVHMTLILLYQKLKFKKKRTQWRFRGLTCLKGVLSMLFVAL